MVLFWNCNAFTIKPRKTNRFYFFQDRKVLYLGIIQAFFEASLFIFVFEWTPVLTKAALSNTSMSEAIPHGLIFSAFMVTFLISYNGIFFILRILLNFKQFITDGNNVWQWALWNSHKICESRSFYEFFTFVFRSLLN